MGILAIGLLVISLGTLSCGITIKTGQTTEEAVASSETRARGIRANWARWVDNAEPKEVAYILKDYIDSTSMSLLSYGWRLEEKWREGNAGRGEAIPDSEMRKIIDAWVTRDRPILEAWEDNIEYAWELIRRQAYYGQPEMSAIKEVIDQYYGVYSGVMFPKGTVEDYSDRLRLLQSETESISQSLSQELE